jgi:hypothetical protein
MSVSEKMIGAGLKAPRTADLELARVSLNTLSNAATVAATLLVLCTLYIFGHPLLAVWLALAGLVWLFVAGAVKATGD